MRASEDMYSPESEHERTLSTFRNRIKLWNFCETILNKRYIPRVVADTGIDITVRDEMVDWITKNNERIDTIREHLKLYGTSVQRAKLNIPLE